MKTSLALRFVRRAEADEGEGEGAEEEFSGGGAEESDEGGSEEDAEGDHLSSYA